MPRILFHCHVFPKGVFERNLPDSGIEGTPAELARCARELGFDRAVAFAPGAATEASNYAVEGDPNEWLAGAVADGDCADFLIPFMRVNPAHGDAAVTQMETYAARGFAGIKIHPESQRIDVSDPALDGFFAAAEELGLPIVTHTGVLSGKWPLSKHEPRLFEPFIAGHPELVLIMAHAGGAAFFRQVLGLMQSYPNVYADITGTLVPSAWYLPPHELNLFRHLGLSARLIYGCDWPWGGMPHVEGDLKALAATEFSDAEKEGILGGTLARLLEPAL
jgi:predicted TIM-barrel fold metal-dependent hydrolase